MSASANKVAFEELMTSWIKVDNVFVRERTLCRNLCRKWELETEKMGVGRLKVGEGLKGANRLIGIILKFLIELIHFIF